jgi:hypothetical protein
MKQQPTMSLDPNATSSDKVVVYDLSPVNDDWCQGTEHGKRSATVNPPGGKESVPSYAIDPWETVIPDNTVHPIDV